MLPVVDPQITGFPSRKISGNNENKKELKQNEIRTLSSSIEKE
jgi:hypothetical protein